MTTFCNRTKYVLKTDDDMFVNMFTIVKHLTDLYGTGVVAHRRRLIICYVFWRMHVQRHDLWLKLGISVSALPDVYPPYCSGMGYILSVDVAVALYRVSANVPFFWVDDAYISGILPVALRDAGVRHVDMMRAYSAAREIDVYTHETEWYKYAFTHLKNERVHREKWAELTEMARTRTIPTPPGGIRPGFLCDEYLPKKVIFPELYNRERGRS